MIQSTSQITNQYSKYKNVSFKKETSGKGISAIQTGAADSFEKNHTIHLLLSGNLNHNAQIPNPENYKSMSKELKAILKRQIN